MDNSVNERRLRIVFGKLSSVDAFNSEMCIVDGYSTRFHLELYFSHFKFFDIMYNLI